MQAKWPNAVVLTLLLLGSFAPTPSAPPDAEEPPASPPPTLPGASKTLLSEDVES